MYCRPAKHQGSLLLCSSWLSCLYVAEFKNYYPGCVSKIKHSHLRMLFRFCVYKKPPWIWQALFLETHPDYQLKVCLLCAIKQLVKSSDLCFASALVLGAWTKFAGRFWRAGCHWCSVRWCRLWCWFYWHSCSLWKRCRWGNHRQGIKGGLLRKNSTYYQIRNLGWLS